MSDVHGKIELYRANIIDPRLTEGLNFQYASVQREILLPFLDLLSQGRRRCHAWIYLSPCQVAHCCAVTQKDSLTGSHCPTKKYWRKPEVYLKLFLHVLYCTQKVSLWIYHLLSPKVPMQFQLSWKVYL